MERGPAEALQVADVVRACGAAGVPIVPQGGNTGLVGASIPHDGEVVLSLRRLDTIETVDPVERTLGAGAGVTLAAAQAAATAAGLMLGIDLAARDSATLGGVVATNAGGLRVIRHGTTRNQLLGAQIVLGDGSVVRRYPFAEGIVPGAGSAFEVERASFDRVLLRRDEQGPQGAGTHDRRTKPNGGAETGV